MKSVGKYGVVKRAM